MVSQNGLIMQPAHSVDSWSCPECREDIFPWVASMPSESLLKVEQESGGAGPSPSSNTYMSHLLLQDPGSRQLTYSWSDTAINII